MTKSLLRTTSICLGLVAVSACATPVSEPPMDFGDAVRTNIALHVVNPDGAGDPTMTFDGERQALARERYAEDKVETPGEAQTTDVQVAVTGVN